MPLLLFPGAVPSSSPSDVVMDAATGYFVIIGATLPPGAGGGDDDTRYYFYGVI